LYLVKSNKEYDALSQEIDHMKATISSIKPCRNPLKVKNTNIRLITISGGVIAISSVPPGQFAAPVYHRLFPPFLS